MRFFTHPYTHDTHTRHTLYSPHALSWSSSCNTEPTKHFKQSCVASNFKTGYKIQYLKNRIGSVETDRLYIQCIYKFSNKKWLFCYAAIMYPNAMSAFLHFSIFHSTSPFILECLENGLHHTITDLCLCLFFDLLSTCIKRNGALIPNETTDSRQKTPHRFPNCFFLFLTIHTLELQRRGVQFAWLPIDRIFTRLV